MTKRKINVQWVAVLCLVALLIGALSVFLFRNPATAAVTISGTGAREDFSTYKEGALYERTADDYANCIDSSNWGEYFLQDYYSSPSNTNSSWCAYLFNGRANKTVIGNNVAKSLGVETVDGNVGDKALKLAVGGYLSGTKIVNRADDSVRLDMLVQKTITAGSTLYYRFRFMVPNTTSQCQVYPKFVLNGSGTWPGEFINVDGDKLTIAKGTTVTLDPGHWYDVVWCFESGTSKATVYVDGTAYTQNYSAAFNYMDYPTWQAYPSYDEGAESIMYVDDIALYERVGSFSVLTDRMDVVSSEFALNETGITLAGSITVDELRAGITTAYDVSVKVTENGAEVTDGNAVIKDGSTLVFTTSGGSYTVNVPITVLPDRPADKDVSDTFNDVSFRIGKTSTADGKIYKGSATALLDGVDASSVFGDADSLIAARAPFKRAGDMALIFSSGKASASADMTALRTESFPYAAGYGHILEFDVISTGTSGTLTVSRTAVADKVTIAPGSVTFAGSSLSVEANRYHHIVWEITASGTQNVYADGVLVGTKTGSALSSAGGVSFRMTKTSATEAGFALDTLVAYCKSTSYKPEADTSYPLSDVMNVTEEARTFYIQGANFDAVYLLGTFTEGDVALYDKDGNEVTKGNFDRKTGILVYYPENNGTPKFYTLGNPTFSFSSIYADGMVLQREKEICLTGFSNAADIDATATLTDENGVIIAIGSAKTTAGQFSITLPAQSAAKGLALNIRIASGAETFYDKTFSDVAVGEVWILSGQSNMWVPLHHLEDASGYLANADNYGDNIRYFTQSRAASFEEQTDTVGGGWYTATAANLSAHEISGIGYVMAARLADQLDGVPVAVINAYYAGSSVTAWFDLDTVENKYPSLYDTYLDYQSKGTPSSWNFVPSSCYNQMVHPIKGYTARGIVWYQGESNTSTPDLYLDYYKTLTSLWREWLHNDELPFMVMQLAPYPGNSYSAFRNAQYNMVQNDPYSYLISTSEDGPVFSAADNRNGFGYSHVHPARKSGIGLRTADMILGEIYDVDLGRAHKAPEVVSVTRDGDRVILTFDTDLTLLHGNTVEGFTLDGVAAVGVIDGKTLTLSAEGVSAPKTVAYAQDKLTVVMKDGTVYRNVTNVHVGNDGDSNRTYNDNSYTTFVTEDGKTITVGAGSHDVIRSTYGGNLTNESGYALPAFSLTVSAE